MILDGVSYSVFTHLCRVILSRMMNPTGVILQPGLLLVFNLTLSGIDVCLDWHLRPNVCFPQRYAVNTIRSTSSSPRLLVFPSGEGVSTH